VPAAVCLLARLLRALSAKRLNWDRMKLVARESPTNKCASALAFCAASFIFSPVRADECQITGGFERLDDDNYATMTTGAAGCFRIFPVSKATRGRVVLKSVAIVSKPQYGSLLQPSRSSFDYKPKAGFKGQDKFSLKVCGQHNSRAGCATVSYIVTVYY
jgi:hypothetical protein